MQPAGMRIAAVVFSLAAWGIIITVGMHFSAMKLPLLLLTLYR